MKKTLPWETCQDDYNTLNCYSVEEAKACTDLETYYNRTCIAGDEFCAKFDYEVSRSTLIPFGENTARNHFYNSSCSTSRPARSTATTGPTTRSSRSPT